MNSKLIGRWVVVIGLVALMSLACDAAGVPSPELFGGLIAGMTVALSAGWKLAPPRPALTASQAVLGVVAGAYFETSTIEAIGADALPIIGVCIATLVLTVAAGLLLARISPLDRPTAAFGVIAGGASGIIAIADELGADNRLVAVMQYLRVFIVLALMPVVAEVIFAADSAGVALGSGKALALGDSILFLGICLIPGVLLHRFTSIPAAALLGPLVAAAALTIADAPFAGSLPSWMQVLAFIVIGLQVGLRFTPDSLRSAGNALIPGLVVILAMLVCCALLGLALAAATDVSQLDAYLATTPGGLYAVIAVAVHTGGDATFVTAVQVLRIFIMLLAAPALARWVGERRAAALERP